ISHVESRYVAPFMVLIAASISIELLRRGNAPGRHIATVIGILFALFPAVSYLNGSRSSQAQYAKFHASDATLASWMRVMGKSYATVGPSYDAGMPAYLSGAQLNATVN